MITRPDMTKLYEPSHLSEFMFTLYYRNTVIGRDRDGNDIMADGSINVKVSVLNEEIQKGYDKSKEEILDPRTDKNKFDITACIGSPEKLPATDDTV